VPAPLGWTDFTAPSHVLYIRLAEVGNSRPTLRPTTTRQVRKGDEMRITRRRLGVGMGLAALVAVTGVGIVAPAAVAKKSPETGKANRGDRPAALRRFKGVNFIGNCRFSHRAPDDPIVFFGMPGASHDHSFVGNRTTNAFSTTDSLLSGSTTCRRRAETAAYWMPTLLVDGSPVAPEGATIYYRRRTLKRVTAPPAGFKMIAGDSKASSPQPMQVTFWNCSVQAGVPASSTPPACPSGRGTSLRLHVTFPSCWNGVSLDSPNHKDHVAYPMNGRCPSGYEVALPQISLIYRYPVSGQHAFELASTGVYSAHADFFNAWDQATLERLTDSCLNALRRCGQGG